MVERLNALGTWLRYEYEPDPAPPAPPDGLILPVVELADHRSPGHATLLRSMAERGFGARKRLISASAALRVGWATGFEVGSYVVGRLIPRVTAASLVLEGGLVRAVRIHRASFDPTGHLSPECRRVAMADRLYEGAAGFARTHHEWSRLSERAIFSMLESSWAGQFVTFGEAVGQGQEAAEEAAAVLASHPVLAQDAPALYPVEAGGKRKTCQRRTLCCLYYRMPAADFCGSCPILPEDERTIRQRKYVAEYGQPMF